MSYVCNIVCLTYTQARAYKRINLYATYRSNLSFWTHTHTHTHCQRASSMFYIMMIQSRPIVDQLYWNVLTSRFFSKVIIILSSLSFLGTLCRVSRGAQGLSCYIMMIESDNFLHHSSWSWSSSLIYYYFFLHTISARSARKLCNVTSWWFTIITVFSVVIIILLCDYYF